MHHLPKYPYTRIHHAIILALYILISIDDLRAWYDYYSAICNQGLSREMYSYLTNDELELELELWYVWYIIYFNKNETKYMNAQQSFLKAASMCIKT